MDKRSNDRGICTLAQSPDGREPSEIYEINAYELANQILEDYTQPDSKYVQGLTGSLGIIHAYFTPKPSDYVEPDTWNNVRKSFSQKFVESPLQKWGFGGMDDITQQLVLKWERFGPDNRISLVQDFFLLALDSMGLSVLNIRFNSFYKSELVPFVGYLYELAERLSGGKPADWAIPDPNSEQSKSNKPPVQGDSTIDTKEVDGLANLVLERLKEAIRKRVISPNKYDVLSDIMQVDEKKRNENLDAVSRYLAMLSVATIGLISSVLSFAIYELLKNEPARKKLQEEIDEVLQGGDCKPDHLSRMPYLTAVLEETLRLHPPVPKLAFFASEDKAFNDTTIPKGSKIFIDVESILKDTDPIAWGEDANEFKPERMEGIKFEDDKRLKSLEKSKDTYFGNPFITMLAKLAIVSLFQRFDFKLADADYHLNCEQQIGPVPGNLLLHASLRGQSQSSAGVTEEPPVSQVTQTPTPHTPEKKETPIYILWGGRDGTCENYAETLLRWAPANGYKPIMAELNRYAKKDALPKDGPVIIIAATYAGYPTENAKDFHAYLSKVPEKSTELEGVKYAVFGCGRSGWSDTYQKIPIEFDEKLKSAGAKQLIDRGEFDAGRPSTADAFDDWAAKLWNVLSKQYDVTYDESLYREVYEIRQIGNADARHRILRQRDTISAVVVENRTISNPDGTLPARHIELRMRVKEACKYQPGDVISVLPTNPIEDVHRVFRHFRMPLEQEFRVEKLSSSVFETLPAGERVKVFELLINFVELGKPAQKSHLRILMKHTRNEDTKRELQSEINTSLANTIKNHLSILDYLERYRDIELPFNKFFIMLPYMRTREYSISSSPLWKPNTLTLSYQEHKKGVSSGYLARQSPGDVIRFTWRVSSHAHFGLPERPDKDGNPVPANEAEKPVVMFATGTGIAPFRSMIQDRWVRARQGEKVGKMILFFGCRDPKKDFLYADSDLKDWMDQKNWKGERLLDVRPAFSRPPDEAAKVQSSGCKYIQDRAQKDADLLIEVYDNGARYLTCGNVAASKGLEAVGKDIVRKGHEKKGKTPPPPEEIKKFIGQIYFTDVFG